MRRRPRRRQRSRKLLKIVSFASLIILGFGSIIVGMRTSAADSVESPQPVTSVVATPAAEPRTTPGARPVAEPLNSFLPATIQIPAVGISGPVSEYTADMLIDGAVAPQTYGTISWYSSIPGSTLKRDATNTAYIYGHSWIKPAAFNNLRDVVIGDRLIIRTSEGTLVYMAEEMFSVDKPGLSSDPRLIDAVAGRVFLITCDRPVGYPDDQGTVDNRVVRFQLIPLREPVEPSGGLVAQ